MKPARAARRWLAKIGPYVIAGVVVAALLRKYGLDAIWKALREGNSAALWPIGIGTMLVGLGLVSTSDAILIRSTLGAPSYWDVVRGKAGTAVLMTVGYGAGFGGYALWLARATGVGFAGGLGLALFVIASDLCAASWIATFGILSGTVEIQATLRWLMPTIAAATLALLLLSAGRHAPRGDVLEGTRLGFLRAWRTVPRGAAALQLVGRMLNILLMITATWLGSRVFGLSFPYAAMATYLPIIAVVGSLPLNVAGLGAVQGAWVILFQKWAPEPSIIAFVFVWHLTIGAGVVLRGLPFVRRVVQEIAEGQVRRDAESKASGEPGVAA